MALQMPQVQESPCKGLVANRAEVLVGGDA